MNRTFYIYLFLTSSYYMHIFLTLCYYIIIGVCNLTGYTSIILLYYRGKKKVWVWRHERGIIAIRSQRNDILFYAATLTRFLPCVCIYIHIFSLFSSILHLASYFKFRGWNFLKGVDCNDLFPILQFLYFNKWIYENALWGKVLTFVDWRVVSRKTRFLGISS